MSCNTAGYCEILVMPKMAKVANQISITGPNNLPTEIAEHWMAAALDLTAHTGMRRGEVLGLTWRDVDLDAARLSVHQAVITVEYQVTVADVKTGTARRTIDLDERTVEVLRAWRTEREREAALIGATVSEDETVFARPDGELTHPDYFSQVFDRHCAGSELPRIRFHDLRHTHATILLKAGVPGGAIGHAHHHGAVGAHRRAQRQRAAPVCARRAR